MVSLNSTAKHESAVETISKVKGVEVQLLPP